jgi:phosphoglycerate dehydrogenase-like enzyme
MRSKLTNRLSCLSAIYLHDVPCCVAAAPGPVVDEPALIAALREHKIVRNTALHNQHALSLVSGQRPPCDAHPVPAFSSLVHECHLGRVRDAVRDVCA